jgi:hypothetical protein
MNDYKRKSGGFSRRKGQRVQNMVAKTLRAHGIDCTVTARAGFKVNDLVIKLSNGRVLNAEVKGYGRRNDTARFFEKDADKEEKIADEDRIHIIFYVRTGGGFFPGFDSMATGKQFYNDVKGI